MILKFNIKLSGVDSSGNQNIMYITLCKKSIYIGLIMVCKPRVFWVLTIESLFLLTKWVVFVWQKYIYASLALFQLEKVSNFLF